jgi:hypothetical protein
LEDSAAFGIGTTVVGLVQFVLGVLSISLLNYTAQQQVSLNCFHTSQERFGIISIMLVQEYKCIYEVQIDSLLITVFQKNSNKF